MRAKLLVSCLMIVFCLCLGACGSDEGASSTAKKDGGADGTVSASKKDGKAAATARWNAYIALGNESPALMEIFSKYVEVLGRNPEPVITNNLDRFVNRVGENSAFFNRINDTVTAKVLEQAATSEQTDLDKAAKAFAENVRTTLALQKEAQQYYAAKSYVDDKLAKGKEMHTKILAAYDELAASYVIFSDITAEQDRQNTLREAQEKRAEGMKALPAALEFLVAAQDAASKLPEEGAPDPAALKADYDTMVKALAELQAAAADEGQLQKEHLFKDKMGQVVKWAGELKATMTSMMELASNSGQPPRKPGRDETPEAFMKLLNHYINAYNLMIQIRS